MHVNGALSGIKDGMPWAWPGLAASAINAGYYCGMSITGLKSPGERIKIFWLCKEQKCIKSILKTRFLKIIS